MIHLKIKLADGTTIDIDELADHIKDTETLTLFLDREIVINPKSLQWIEGTQSFEDAETYNEEGEDGEGGFIPYDEFGVPIRDLEPDEQAATNENNYYYQIETAEWVGKSDYELYVANWMNDHHDSYKDIVTHGCVNGTMSDLVHHNQILQHIKYYKTELEVIIQEIADSLDDMGFLFGQSEYNKRDFSFDRLVWMCFEETVRQTVAQLNLNDI